MLINIKIFFCIVVTALYLSETAVAGIGKDKDSIQVSKIWDYGQHNAFTDLIRFKNRFYCSFREGAGHAGERGQSGKVRILVSKDGKEWESIALLEVEGVDLRDPKLSLTPSKKIMVTMDGITFDKTNFLEQLYPVVSFSDRSGKLFTSPEKAVLDRSITSSKDWAWRVDWQNGIGYAINYQLKENLSDRSLLQKDAWLIYLMKTLDGKYFEKVSQLDVLDLPNEAIIRFDKSNTDYVLVRKEAGDKMGVLAKSNFPYTNREYANLSFKLGGPNFIFYEKNKLIVGIRLYEKSTLTGILVTDLDGNILKTIKLPSGGDRSYTGLLLYKKKLWVSYYSSHEGKTQIYLAEIPLANLQT